MKFMVNVDLEGVACAYGPCEGSIEDSFNIEFVRKQAQEKPMPPCGHCLNAVQMK